MATSAPTPVASSSFGVFRTVSASRLRTGARLNFPIQDDRGVLLLAEGLIITDKFLQQLRSRGIESIRVHQKDIPRICAGEPQGTASEAQADRHGVYCPLRNAGTELLDQVIQTGKLSVTIAGTPFVQELDRHGATAYSEPLKREMADRCHVQTLQIERVFQDLLSGQGLDVAGLSIVTETALADMSRDSDLFASLGVNPFADGYPARHSLHVAMLATLMGTRMRFDRQTLKDLAMGCLIHDSGMLKVDKRLYNADRTLTTVEFLEITKHPVTIFDMIKDLGAVSYGPAIIAYQMHERCNGSGYPRRRQSGQIHFLSKLAGVADAYIGLVSPRRHRAALLPYYAMETMLRGVAQGLYDSASVKALLQCVSLFPIGSYVQLSDSRVGRVVRTPADLYMRPVLETWEAGHRGQPPVLIDLSQEENVEIVRPLATLEEV